MSNLDIINNLKLRNFSKDIKQKILPILEKNADKIVFIREMQGLRDVLYFEEKNLSDFSLTTLKLKYSNIETKLPAFLEENPNLSGIFITTSKAYQIASFLSPLKDRKIALIGYDLIKKNVNFLNEGLVHFLIHQNQKRQNR